MNMKEELLQKQVSQLLIERKNLEGELNELKDSYEWLDECHRIDGLKIKNCDTVIKNLRKEHEAFEQAVVQVFGWEALNCIKKKANEIEKTL